MLNKTKIITFLPDLIAFTFIVSTLSCSVEIDKLSPQVSHGNGMLNYLENRAHPVGWPAQSWDLLVNDYVQQNMKYPQKAQEYGIEGNVHISFTVSEDSSIRNLKVTKSLGYGCDEEAIRLFKSIGKWHPTVLNGQAVRSDIALQIVFKKQTKIKK